MTAPSLRPLRLKLTLWYLATFSAIIALLGGGLFIAISHRFSRELGHSLHEATTQLRNAANTRELEAEARGNVVDAVEELHVSDRTLYLLDTAGTPITPRSAPDWVRTAARNLGPAGVRDLEHEGERDRMLRLHAERFTLRSGVTQVAVAVADKIELEDRYAELIAQFGGAAAIALVLVTVGGWLLVRQSTAPIERNLSQMRQFMADAAHELRTPITVLRTQAEVALQRDREPDAYRGSLRSIESESRRLGRIVDDLLTLARADAGERAVTASRVFLDDIVMDATSAAGALASARGTAVTLTQFEEAAVMGDPELLRQLVMILLDNAIKFTPSGGQVRVNVGVAGERAVVTVSDTGPGIAAEHLPHVFERFFRGDPARSRGVAEPAASGAGLGLSIALWIAQAMNGTIEITSEPGEGTVARAMFPLAPAPAFV